MAWISTATSGSRRTRSTRTSPSGASTAKTGEVKHFKVNRNDGRAANAHGLTRDNEGNFWFDVDTGRRGLGKMDPKTEKITRLPVAE